MYPNAFQYHQAHSAEEAVRLLSELGEEAKLLAGGQSLVPLMKLRLASPAHLVDLNFVPDFAYVRPGKSAIRIGALTRHADIEASPVAQQIPILYDCASGIADVQIRNRGTLGGSLAEADPSGDWGTVLLTLNTTVHTVGPQGERSVPLSNFFVDAFTTALGPAELIREVTVEIPPKTSGGAYLAFKRCAPVYPTASAAVQLTLDDSTTCREARIALGCVGLTAIRPAEAERALRGHALSPKNINAAVEAARAASDPQRDIRGSVEYKRDLVAMLVRKAIDSAARRARGERVELSHFYA